MPRRKSVEKMSAEELYELARQREQEEATVADQSKEQIAELKAQRKALVAEHTKALKAIDKELATLQGGKKRRAKRGSGAPRGQLSARALELVAKHGPIQGRDLKARLEKEGLDATYLAQALAGLKKKGQVTSPSRGVYQAA
jgi:DNA replicative helicase MCM subunit Mcm2 (Cdc46/Mcm family)